MVAGHCGDGLTKACLCALIEAAMTRCGRRFFDGVEVKGRVGKKNAPSLLSKVSVYLAGTAACASRN